MSGRGNIGEPYFTREDLEQGQVESCYTPDKDLNASAQPLPLFTFLAIHHHHVKR